MHNQWFVIIGGLLVLMALVGSLVKRLPLSASVIYLCVGFATRTVSWRSSRPECSPRRACPSGATRLQVGFLGWFGIRGIGSIYYLSYAIQHGLPRDHAGRIASLVLTTIAVSIVVHGVSVTPLMGHYERVNRYLRERRSRPGGVRTSIA